MFYCIRVTAARRREIVPDIEAPGLSAEIAKVISYSQKWHVMTILWEFLLQDYKINNASLHCIVYRRKPLPNCNYKSFKENESWLWKQVMQMMFLFDFVESNHKSAVDSRLELGTEILIVKKTRKTFPTAFRREEGNWQPSSSYSFHRLKIQTGCNSKKSNFRKNLGKKSNLI